MNPKKSLGNFSANLKDRLIQQALERRTKQLESKLLDSHSGNNSSKAAPQSKTPQEEFLRLDLHPGYQRIRIIREGAAKLGVKSPFFLEHDGLASATTSIGGRLLVNFASYNYLGLCGHPSVNAAAKQAIDDFGTSVSASRIVSGERPLHRQLEQAIASAYATEDAVVMVSGHATTVSTLGCLFGPKDLILHDSLIHNCALEGAKLCGAKRIAFPHNDWNALDALLSQHRNHHQRAVILIEGHYSMDGDIPDLPRFVAVKRRHRAFLMVDEAHSFGVLGASGLGIREMFDLDSEDVDIWMGTLSKALAGCGGYIAGKAHLIEHLKFAASGFVYSVGMAPPVAAAALKSLEILRKEPYRVGLLHKRAQQFLGLAKKADLPTGLSSGKAIIPVITASSLKATKLSNALAEHGINAQPILYPAVPENAARLRFFISCEHSEEQIESSVAMLTKLWKSG